MIRTAAFAVLPLVLAAGSAQAQTPPPAQQPCAIAAQSRTGGAIEIVASIPGQGAGPQLIWQPIGSGPKVVLWVTYPASAIAHMDDPSGVMIRFRMPPNADPQSFSVAVTGHNGRAWRFEGKTISADPGGETAHVAFGLDWPYGRGLISAVAEAQPLAITVQKDDGTTLESETFGLANIDARDTLLAQARAKFQALGAVACPATAPRPGS